MADPISGGIGKATQQMMQEVQRQMQQQAQQPNDQLSAQKTNFQNMVQQPQQVGQTNNLQQVNQVNKVNEATRAVDVLKTAQNQSLQQTNSSTKLGAKAVEAKPKTERTGLKTMLNQIVEGQNKLDDIIRMATSGRSFSNQELLAVQASVYKFSQELDLTSKVVEKATSGVKQTMQTQV